MSKSYCFIDFEFSRITEQFPLLVCAATYDTQTRESKTFWLHKSFETQTELFHHLKKYDTIIAYSAIAECRSFLSLSLEPLDFEWIDLFLEYRCLTNHNDHLQWGEQLVDGKVKKVFKPRPKWQLVEGEKAQGFSATHSLSEATFKLSGEKRDTKHKTQMRDLIISDPEDYTENQKKDILAYCLEDVVHLPKMLVKMFEEYNRLEPGITKEERLIHMKTRGRYAALTSHMESKGYPVDIEATKNFSRQVGNIIYDLQKEINGLFPDIKPFKWNRKEQRYSVDQSALTKYIDDRHSEHKWLLTDTGRKSLALEAWEKLYSFQHDYPKDNFGAQMLRYLKLKQSLYGFGGGGSSKKNFWDSVGSDGRVRPYLNIYKAQSSRSQPSATSFMFLKPAWMRALVVPERGKFMASIDYGSQEFLISAILAEDENMIEAYRSGDPYLAFGILSEQIPKDGTKESHPEIRDLCKSTVLGISYNMTKYGLAIKLSNDSGVVWSEAQAQAQIDLFYSTFHRLKKYHETIPGEYEDRKVVSLPCGWRMWGDNPNLRSVGNMRIQGYGASIMRKAVDLAFSRGLYIPFTLHDALYLEDNVGEEWKIAVLRDCMKEAFTYYFEEEYKESAKIMRLDPFAWSPDYKEGGNIVIGGWKVPKSNLYVDSRSIKDYEKFKRYFKPREEDSL